MFIGDIDRGDRSSIIHSFHDKTFVESATVFMFNKRLK